MIFFEQRLGALFKLGMHFDAIDGADDLALRFVVVSHAFGARTGVDQIDLCAHRDCIIGTLWFAHVAVDAFVSNAQRHVLATQRGRDAQLAPLFGLGLQPTID